MYKRQALVASRAEPFSMATMNGELVPGACTPHAATAEVAGVCEPSVRASGYEQEKLHWEDKADMVTISMPMSKECLRSLAVHTGGFQQPRTLAECTGGRLLDGRPGFSWRWRALTNSAWCGRVYV